MFNDDVQWWCSIDVNWYSIHFLLKIILRFQILARISYNILYGTIAFYVVPCIFDQETSILFHPCIHFASCIEIRHRNAGDCITRSPKAQLSLSLLFSISLLLLLLLSKLIRLKSVFAFEYSRISKQILWCRNIYVTIRVDMATVQTETFFCRATMVPHKNNFRRKSIQTLLKFNKLSPFFRGLEKRWKFR